MVDEGTVSSGPARNGLNAAPLLLSHLDHVKLATPVGLAEPAELAHGVAHALE